MNAYTGTPIADALPPITNNGFFPDLTVQELIVKYRVANEFEADVIKDRLITAMIDINTQLRLVRDALASYATLAAYCAAHSEQINGVEILLTKYKDAVFSYARSFLLEKSATLKDNTKQAYDVATENNETESYWRNRSTDATAFIFKAVGIAYEPTGRTSAIAVLI